MRALVLAIAGCGRVGFDAVPDAPADAPAAPLPAFETAGSASTTGSNRATLSVALVGASPGDLIVVAFTSHDAVAVTGVTDDAGNAYRPTGARAAMGVTASELWYATGAAPATKVTATLAGASSFDMFALAFRDAAGAPVVAEACTAYPPVLATAPLAIDRGLIVTATMFEYPVFASAMDPPFVGLPPVTGNDAGYLIAEAPGTYASTFQLASGQGQSAAICAVSAAWAR